MIERMEKGYLYVFEGPDGVGKTSLIDRVFERLIAKGYPTTKLSFPGKDPGSLGAMVYQIHHNPGLFDLSGLYPPSLQILHIAAHADVIRNKIFPLYQKGTIILLDRYWWSTLVYGKVAGVDEKILKSILELELLFWEEIKPDLLFLLDRESPFQKDEELANWMKIRAAYLRVIIEEKDKYPIVRVINDKSLEVVSNQIFSKISQTL